MVSKDRLVNGDRTLNEDACQYQWKIEEDEGDMKETKDKTKEEEVEGSIILHKVGQRMFPRM